MKKKVLLKRITHREKSCIAMIFDYDEMIKARVKSVAGSTYSKTNRCFYVDDSEENLKLILKSLRDYVDVDINLLVQKEDQEVVSKVVHGMQDMESFSSGSLQNKPPVMVQSEKTTEDSSGMVDRIKTGYKRFGPVEFRINENEGLLVIKFIGIYDREWIEELTSYGRCYYDKVRKEWFLPWAKLTCDSLADYFAHRGIEVRVKKHIVNDELLDKRKAKGEEIRSRVLGSKALDYLESLKAYLEESRYSTRTTESYMAMLEYFFRYFNDKDPNDISSEEISGFLHDIIVRLGYSASYQNQMISAIKTFYSLTGKGDVNPDLIERPRRRRALPKVFSKEEVRSILNSAGNIKHKLLLWIIYSCGLRRSEVINIKLVDLDRTRGIIHIREGKGMVDRIVPVSDKVWQKIDEYSMAYSPRKYLFEGQNGGRYSAESVYRVFKRALHKAGIRKDVGVHSLRHSYATHLHENGLDIRYIQELLGHKSTRTTEIYTHVSRRNLIQVRSPFEDLDVR